MLVQSPLKKTNPRPNLRAVPKPSPGAKDSRQKDTGNFRQASKKTVKKVAGTLRPGKVMLFALIAGALGFLYLTHAFATQKLLDEVRVLETEYNKARSRHDALKLQFDRMVGPAEIYKKAQEAGFINAGPADELITIKRK